ncbi:MAG: sulfotransferase domain-containing protein [Verrucomicrobiota bacterium]|nr:sulfotransferase domain-containing protein [Verrucomicrobiota bacterium]
MKPNFFIVGAPKCGTTAWVQYLGSHPDIFFSTPKEPHYFCYDFPNYRWVKNPDDYLRLFENSGSAQAVGEASVQYLYSEVAAKAIRDFNSNAKIIILIRDQENFLPSLHNQLVFNGDEIIKDFELAWRLSSARDRTNTGWFCRELKFLDYKAAGHFSRQIERYFECFPAEQIRVFHFHDWTLAPRDTYLEILRFLGVEDDGRTEFVPMNVARRRRLNWLTPLIKRPPRPLLAAFRTIKRISGLGTGLRAKLLTVNSGGGYLTEVRDELRAEVRRYYQTEKVLVEPRIWRPGN